jgi:hypothetical protein
MKNKLVNLYYRINTIDPRYLQAAYFVLVLGVSLLITNSPADGGTGTR